MRVRTRSNVTLHPLFAADDPKSFSELTAGPLQQHSHCKDSSQAAYDGMISTVLDRRYSSAAENSESIREPAAATTPPAFARRRGEGR